MTTQVLAPPVAKRIQARHVVCGDYIYVGPNNTDAILEAITQHMKHCPKADRYEAEKGSMVGSTGHM